MIRLLTVALGLLALEASAAQVLDYDGHEWVKPELEWDHAAAPTVARARVVVSDQRGAPFDEHPQLIGQDGGVSFNSITVVHKDMDAVLLYRRTVEEVAEHVAVAAAARVGLTLSKELPRPAPTLRLDLKEFWCAEPGDDDQRCRMSAVLALHVPGEEGPVWRERVHVGWDDGRESDRDLSFTLLIEGFTDRCARELDEGEVARLAAPWLDDVDRQVASVLPPARKDRPDSWLVVVDERGK